VTDEGGSSAGRRPRADAERNRARLLATAKTIFAAKGSNASLDEIARSAGVGAGTLYRHFPTRDALIAAVYLNETEQLATAADRLAETHAPVPALREWLLLFVDYIATKHGMYEVLNSMAGGTSDLYSASSTQMKGAMTALVDRAVSSGHIRLNLDPFDLLRAIASVATAGSGADGNRAAKHLVDILVAGIRANYDSSRASARTETL
jgi:AcrR family transcriptional regulator